MPGGITFSYIHMYHKWRLYDHSLHFPPPNNPENQKFKTEKTHGDIIILHICTINDNNMMYGSWDTKCDGNLENWKEGMGILSFYTCVA